MILRPATLSDLALLQHWDEQPHVVAADPSDDWDWESELVRQPKWREQLIGEENGRPIGMVQIIDPAHEETHYWGTGIASGFRAIDIWIGAANDLGRGLGTAMMQLALQRCFAATEVTAVWVDPLATNPRAHRFYRRFGFKQKECRQFGEDECLIFELGRPDWEAKS